MPAKKQSQVCIVTVTGIDKVGIIARLANTMAQSNINIIDVNQKIMGDYFVMTMAIEMDKANIDIVRLKKKLDKIAEDMTLKITVQDAKIFKAMHRV
ncbi:MAG: ACT domain-containing protein [Phycisphaerae bacterium]|jgi:ACT domain-containing protein